MYHIINVGYKTKRLPNKLHNYFGLICLNNKLFGGPFLLSMFWMNYFFPLVRPLGAKIAKYEIKKIHRRIDINT